MRKGKVNQEVSIWCEGKEKNRTDEIYEFPPPVNAFFG